MLEFTFGPLGESWSVPGSRQLVGQASNFTFESACGLLQAKHLPIAIKTTKDHLHVLLLLLSLLLVAGLA